MADVAIDSIAQDPSLADVDVPVDSNQMESSSSAEDASIGSESSVSDHGEILKIIESAIERLESLLADGSADSNPSLKDVLEELKRIDMTATRSKRKRAEENRERKKPKPSSNKDEYADIRHHIELTKKFVAPSIEVDDTMSLFDYGTSLRSDGFQKPMEILDSKNSRLNFGRTCVYAVHPTDVPDKYRSMKGRVQKLMEIDEALLLVFYNHITCLVNFNDTKMEKFSKWYNQSGENERLYIKKFKPSVEAFLDAFYEGDRQEGKRILDMWKDGNFQ